jgi:hypothetical protein
MPNQYPETAKFRLDSGFRRNGGIDKIISLLSPGRHRPGSFSLDGLLGVKLILMIAVFIPDGGIFGGFLGAFTYQANTHFLAVCGPDFVLGGLIADLALHSDSILLNH